MVNLPQIRSELATISRYGPGLVAVFVGGTSGIGESTAREFARHSDKPRIYIVGRSEEAGNKLVSEFKALNAGADTKFIKSDISLLKNVDKACEEIKSQEDKVNLLFLSAGMLTMDGRKETEEGLDQKFSLHYYSRMRFTQNLLPLLNKAAEASPDATSPVLARVISVLGAGLEKQIDMSDLSLKRNFGLAACANHGNTMTSLSYGLLATQNPGVTFFQTQPGSVKTKIDRNLGRVMGGLANAAYALLSSTKWVQSAEESGERHAYTATVDSFGNGGLQLVGPQQEPVGGQAFRDSLKKEGADEKVWEHTLKVFNEISSKGKYDGD